jgi:hypothetical protein
MGVGVIYTYYLNKKTQIKKLTQIQKIKKNSVQNTTQPQTQTLSSFTDSSSHIRSSSFAVSTLYDHQCIYLPLPLLFLNC